MNFCTHALEDLKRWERDFTSLQFHQDAEAAQQLGVGLQDSIKFLLPTNGQLGVEVRDNSDFNFVKMPYPAVAFEYTMTGNYSTGSDKTISPPPPFTKRVVTLVMTAEYASSLFDLDSSFEKDAIVIVPFLCIGEHIQWVPTFVGAILDLNAIIKSNNPKGYEITTMKVFGQSLSDLSLRGDDTPQKAIVAAFVAEMQLDLQIALNALACLNAKNVTHVSVPASEKLNAKRKRNGKLPFFEYKVLDIFLGAGVRKIPSGDGRRLREAMSHLLSSSMRLHTVRGHFKQRKTGLYWWSHFVRGRHEEGVVVKDYNVKIEGVKHEN